MKKLAAVLLTLLMSLTAYGEVRILNNKSEVLFSITRAPEDALNEAEFKAKRVLYQDAKAMLSGSDIFTQYKMSDKEINEFLYSRLDPVITDTDTRPVGEEFAAKAEGEVVVDLKYLRNELKIKYVDLIVTRQLAAEKGLDPNAFTEREALERKLAEIDNEYRQNVNLAQALWNGDTFTNMQDAEMFVQKAYGLKPEGTEGLYLMGALNYAKGRYAEALKYLNESISREKLPKAVRLRVKASKNVGDYAQALEDFQIVRAEEGVDAKLLREGAEAAFHGRNYLTAANLLEEYLDISPSDYEARLMLGRAYYHIGQYARAKHDFRRASNMRPQSGEPFYYLYLAEKRLLNDKAAFSMISRAINADPEKPKYRKHRLSMLKMTEDAALMADDYTAIIRYGFPSENTYLMRARANMKLGNLHKAVSDYSSALRKNPDNITSYYTKGLIHLRLDEYIDVVKNMSEVLRRSPDNTSALAKRGEAYLHLGRNELAVQDLNSVLRENPNSAEALFQRGSAYSRLGSSRPAIRDFTRSLQINNDNADAYFKRAQNYVKLGRFSEAIRDYKTTVSLRPNNAKAYQEMGFVFQKLGRYEEAAANFDRAVAINPESTQLYRETASANMTIGRYDRAEKDYEQISEMNPFSHEAKYKQALAMKKQGKVSVALKTLDEALSLKSDYAEALNLKGSIYDSVNDTNRAMLYYNRAVASSEKYSDALINRGLLNKRIGKLNNACRDFEKACAFGNCTAYDSAQLSGDCSF